METYFPEIFESSLEKENYEELNRRTVLLLQEIVTGADNSREISEIDLFLLELGKPKDYSGKTGEEVKYVKRFEEMSLILTKFTGKDAKKMTVLEYYQAFTVYKAENKPKGRK